MSMSASSFLGRFVGGGVRPNRYRVILPMPGIAGAPGDSTSKISFTCKATSIPASNMGVAPVAYMGRTIKLPGDKEFDDWNVTVYLDTDMVTRRAFERWHDSILAFDRNVAAALDPNLFMVDATVYLLSRTDTILEMYTVQGIFPTAVGEVTLGYDQNDQVAEQQVTFAVNQWSSAQTT